MYTLFFVTPILGAFRNYIKYKQFNTLLFIRSPLISFLIYKIIPLNNNNSKVLISLIAERWVMLSYKSIYSFVYDDYNVKKDKYMKKYNLEYK